MWNNKFSLVMTIGLILFAVLCACGCVKADKELPKSNFSKTTYEGCTYLEANKNSNQAWGLHDPNCLNHEKVSLNSTYNPDYKIFGVQTINGVQTDEHFVREMYRVHYTCRGDTFQFIGDITDCMVIGFDANDVVEWSNL